MAGNKYINKCALYIYKIFKLHNSIYTHRIENKIKKIHMLYGEELDNYTKKFWVEQIKRSILVLIGTMILLLMIIISNVNKNNKSIIIKKSDYGGVEQDYTFGISNNTFKETINVAIPPVKYSEEMLETITAELISNLGKRLLGNNNDLNNILEDLYMPEDTEYGGISITWTTSNYEVVNRTGQVFNEDINMPINVLIKAVITYEDTIGEVEYNITVLPKVYTGEEAMKRKVKQDIEQLIKLTPENIYVEIPRNIDEIEINEITKIYNSKYIIVVLFLLIIPLLYFKDIEELNKKIRIRNIQLLKEYPNFINKLVLLLGAGMNIKGSIHKMVEKKPNKQNYLYEELIITVNELNAGVSESVAYYNLGRRIGIPTYLKVSTLIIQNIKLGSKGLLQQLEQEEVWAFEQRKENAKKLGEEAGTKLLFPMIIQMLIIMIIIMIPAMLNFNI